MNLKFKEIYDNSIKNPNKFWEDVSKDIFWYRNPSKILNQSKWAHRDSNPEPTDYESAALTVELWALIWREIYTLFC